jgi:putative transposase
VDETTLSLDPVLRACWMKVGEQTRIPLPANQEKQHCHIFGAYEWACDQVSWTLAERKNSETFITFLEHLLVEEYPTGCIVLVLDRASYHKSAAALAALSLFEHRVLVFWLPAYCTELNPIERFWRHLKDLACANQLWSGLENVIEAVVKVLHQQNDPSRESRFLLSKNL